MFKKYLGLTCYHTTWQTMAPTINSWNAQAKGKFQAFRYLNKIYKNPVSASRLFKTYYNLASNLSNRIQLRKRASYSILCTLMTSANKSLEKKIFPSGWKCYETIGSQVSCAFIKIWNTWEVCLEQLLRIFRALETSRVPLISMNARWRMKQLLND